MLEVPVLVGIVDQQLLLLNNSTFELIDLPIKPFQLVECNKYASDAEKVTLIGHHVDTYIRRVYYDNIPYIQYSSGKTLKKRPKFDYLVNLFQEEPSIIPSLVKGRESDPYPIFVDIETTGLDFERDSIVTIQISYLDYDDVILLYNSDYVSGDLPNVYDPKTMLVRFIDYCKMSPTGRRPEFIVSYNGNRFDIPFIIRQCRHYKIFSLLDTITPLGDREIIYPSWMGNIENNQFECTYLGNGFLSYDMYKCALADIKLSKAPSRQLKQVAKFYGAKDVYDISKEEKYDMVRLLKHDPDRYVSYAKSDIKILKYLWNVYAIRTIAEANLLGVPFMCAFYMTNGQKSYLPLYREARNHGFYNIDINIDRYDMLYARGKYQGAIVESWAKGYYDKIIYVDAHAMYPSIMDTFNISPDTCILKSVYEFDTVPDPSWTSGLLSFGDSHKRTVTCPDFNYKVVFEFEIDYTNDGYMRKIIKKYDDIRNEYKKKMKSCEKNSPLAVQYDAMQMAAKVINNTYYGINGNKYYGIGDLSYAILVTAVGRWCMIELIKFFGGTPEYPCDDGSYSNYVLESDTDGVLIRVDDMRTIENGLTEVVTNGKAYTINDVNEHIQSKLSSYFGIPKDKLNFVMEFEGAGSIYIYKKKNYILRKDEDGQKLTIKGSAFGGYNEPTIVRRAVDIMARAIMFNECSYDEAYAKCFDFNQPLEMFKITTLLKRDTSEYKVFTNINNYIKFIDAKEGTKLALNEMKKRVREWLTLKVGDNSKLKKFYSKYKGLIADAENEEDLLLVIELIESELDLNEGNAGTYYIVDLLLLARQKGIKLRRHDVLEYYMTPTHIGFSLATDVHSIDDLDLDRYSKRISKIVDRFGYVKPSIDMSIF